MAKLLTLLGGIALVLLTTAAACANQASADESTIGQRPALAWRTDAALRDVFFIDSDLGWAVGDQGTILRTEDGGRSWNLVPVDASCSLCSVHFADEQNGWAVGGQAVPMLDRTNAVILRTQDGGRTWQEMNGTLLPSLREMRMSNDRSGWAWGAPNRHFQSGIFVTDDGGYSWSDFPVKNAPRWSGVAATQDGFVAVDERGQLGMLTGGRFHPVNATATASEIRQVVSFDPTRSWAIGDREILATDNAGKSWQTMDLPQAAGDSARFEFASAARRGDATWLAGSPGTYIYRHDARANRWTRARTPARSAIHKLFFVDEQNGWAVGDCGQVLATRDGGETWQSQRSAANRIALLVVCQSSDTIPFDLLARYSADQGYLTAVVLNRANSIYGDGLERSMEACLRQGVTTFLAPRPSTIGDDASRMAGIIRQMQPSAIVIADVSLPAHIGVSGGRTPSPNDQRAAADLTSTVLSAVAQAADAGSDRAWIEETALPPWQTPFVYRAQAKTDDSMWGSAEFLPELVRNLADHQLVSFALLAHPADMPHGFDLISMGDRSASACSNLFSGLERGPLAPPRRSEKSPRGNLSQLKSINNKAPTLNQLLSQFDASPASIKVWQQRIDRMFADLPAETAGDWLWQLSEAYWRGNQLELAALSRAALVQRCRNHPLNWEARLWLASYYASQELSWAEFSQQRHRAESRLAESDSEVAPTGLRASPAITEIDGVTRYVWTVESPEKHRAPSDPRAEIKGQPDSTSAENFDSFLARRSGISQSLLRSIQQADPELMSDPLLNFADCLLKRRAEGPPAAESSLRKISTRNLPPAWRQNIAREIHLNGSSAWTSMCDAIDCSKTDARPFLDGVLDDDVWRSVAQTGQIIQLSPNSSSHSTPQSADKQEARPVSDASLGQTQIMLAHDDQYLYIAAICRGSSPTKRTSESSERIKRERDQPLDRSDQLQIAIDLDRDGKTYYCFAVDSKGSFGDRLGDDRLWNPTWYLANAHSELEWTFEAAIPLDQLGPPPADTPDLAWGISFRRNRPDGLSERWSSAVSPDAPFPLDMRLSKLDFLPPDGVIRFR